MFYFKKEGDGIIQYHASTQMPPHLNGLIRISQEEYETAIQEFFDVEMAAQEEV